VIKGVELLVVTTVRSGGSSAEFADVLTYLNEASDLSGGHGGAQGGFPEEPLAVLIGNHQWNLLDRYETYYLDRDLWHDVGHTGNAAIMVRCWMGPLNHDTVYYHFAVCLAAAAAVGQLEAVVTAFTTVITEQLAHAHVDERMNLLEEMARLQGEPHAMDALRIVLDRVDFETNSWQWRRIYNLLGEHSHAEARKLMEAYVERKAQAAAQRRGGNGSPSGGTDEMNLSSGDDSSQPKAKGPRLFEARISARK
jgi:hypothetical protein